MSVHSRYRAGLWRPYEKPMYGVLLNPYHPLARGLVGCWLFNEGGGNIVCDLSGHGNHGTLGGGTATNCPSWQPGRGGTALSFDGDNDFIDCGSSPSLCITGALTILLWINSSGLTGYPDGGNDDAGFVSKNKSSYKYFSSSVDKIYELAILNNTLYFQIGNGSTCSSCSGDASSLIDSAWHQIVALWDGTTNTNGMKIYFDGVVKYQATSSISSIQTSNDYLTISGLGTDIYNPTFNGLIDAVFIWERALSAEEIWQLYTDPFCMFYHPALQAELLYAAAPSAVSTPTLTLLGVGR